MDIKRINEELNAFLQDNVLAQTKTKQQAIHKIYKIDHSKIYKDEGWQGVHDLVHAIEELGADVDIMPANSSLYTNGYPNDGSMSCKCYDIIIKFVNALEKEITINGRITCSGCGTVEDPLSMYDVVMTLG